MQQLIEDVILPASVNLVQNVRMQNLKQRCRLILAGFCLLLTACSQQLPPISVGKLVVVVPDVSQGAEAEFERELSTLFGEHLKAAIEFVSPPPDKIFEKLYLHHAHLAAASLRLDVNNAKLQFGPIYQTLREQIICNHDNVYPKKIADLMGIKIATVAGSTQEDALIEAREKSPWLQWESRRTLTVQTLLQEVASGAVDCTVGNPLQLADARNYYSNLVAAFDIGTPSKLAWAFPADADPQLLKEAQAFFELIKQNGVLNRILDRYYGHTGRLLAPDAATFITKVRKVLPEYRNLFKDAARLTGFDWRLLAALAYQESQWDPLATSFTNVRGMMMLTGETADQMKLKNRFDPRENILAGAKYLALLRDQLPDRIPEPDRTWMALASYNQGYGHLEDARILSERAGLSPDSWVSIKKWMPQMNQPGYYQTLKHGYARGGEAVIMVECIRSYHDMLKRLAPEPLAGDSEEVSYHLLEPKQ